MPLCIIIIILLHVYVESNCYDIIIFYFFLNKKFLKTSSSSPHDCQRQSKLFQSFDDENASPLTTATASIQIQIGVIISNEEAYRNLLI